MQTDRFIIREVEADDIEYIYKGLSHPEVIKYYGVSFHTLEATKEQMQWYEGLRKDKTGIWWCIFTKDTNTFCGAGGYNDADQTHRKAEIGFWLLPEFWGKGIMKEVMPKLLDYGFNELDLNRIEGYVDHNNDKCKKALDKVKFVYEGTMRQAEFEDGKFVDVDIYSRLKSDK